MTDKMSLQLQEWEDSGHHRATPHIVVHFLGPFDYDLMSPNPAHDSAGKQTGIWVCCLSIPENPYLDSNYSIKLIRMYSWDKIGNG